MAVNNIGWTPSLLHDVNMALKVYLARVPFESLPQPSVAENWLKIQTWTDTIQQLLETCDDSRIVDLAPPFPLNSQDLRTLQATIDRIARDKNGPPVARRRVPSEQTARSFRKVKLSAYGLGLLLLTSYTITVIAATKYRGANSSLYVGLNLGVTAVAIVVWAVHFRRLGQHDGKHRRAR